MENRGGGPGRGPMMERRGGMGRPPALPVLAALRVRLPRNHPSRRNSAQGLPPVVWPHFPAGGSTIHLKHVVAALGDLSDGALFTVAWSSRTSAVFLGREEGQINRGRCTLWRSASLPLCTLIP